MKYIFVNKGQFVMVDDVDYNYLSKYTWWVSLEHGHWYAYRSKWDNGKVKHVPMHREIMNAPKGSIVDHIDHNTLNNQRNNLRFVTDAQNKVNSKLPKHNTSGYKGIAYHKNAKKKWAAQISFTQPGKIRKNIIVGFYETKLEAALAYDAALVKLHGEYAATNERLGLLSRA